MKMKPKSLPHLDPVAETMLIPLYYRAIETLLPEPLVYDEQACRILEQLGIDLDHLGGRTFEQTLTMMRAREFDRRASAFLAGHQQAVVVELGCGLDTRFSRVDDGKVDWYNLDLPEVMEIRRGLLPEMPRGHTIAQSLFDMSWTDRIPRQGAILLLAEGVLPYFSEEEVRRAVVSLAQTFPGAEMITDALSPLMIRFSKMHSSLRGFQVRPRWGLGRGAEVETWGNGIHLLDEWNIFDHPERRLGFYRWISPLSPLREGSRILHLRFGI